MAELQSAIQAEKDLQQRISRRIEFAARFRIENNRLPTDEELDKHCIIKGSLANMEVPKELWRQRSESRKKKAGGIIGITYCPQYRIWRAQIAAKFGRHVQSRHNTALEAAMAYNRLAAQYRGKDAVFCDLDAAEKLDQQRSIL